MNKYSCLGAVVATAAVMTGSAFGQCPADGSGADGVAQWTLDNCSGEAVCANPATTCNDEFTIELLGVETVGDETTFTWEVCQIGGSSGLSHWIFGLGQIDCFGENFGYDDLVVGATLNDVDYSVTLGLDPTTQLFGVKFDLPDGLGACSTYSVTFNLSALAENYTLGSGCVTMATKAGPQDITRIDRDSPGYACALGPVCVFVPPPPPGICYCYADETAWSAGPRYTPYDGAETTVTLFAGQTWEAGEVTFSPAAQDGMVEICIALNPGFSFNDVSQNLKIQGYLSAPSGNPAPGQFAFKFTVDPSLDYVCVTVPAANFYGVHVDVLREYVCDCPEEGEDEGGDE